MKLTRQDCITILEGLSPKGQARRLEVWKEAGVVEPALLAEFKAKIPPEKIGVGDIVAHITAALHIPHCGGCEGRRKALNEIEVPNVLGIRPKVLDETKST